MAASRRVAVGGLAVFSLTMVSPKAGAQDLYENLRLDMVQFQLRDRGIRQSELLNAMATVPRHLFVPQASWQEAYLDQPLALGDGGGIPEPYLSALMIEHLALDGTQRVLEVGTGSGYDAAVLSRLAKEVYTIEISEEVGEAARRRLSELGYDNVFVKVGDGHEGWEAKAPFDAILLTAAPVDIPPMLIEQLKMNGRMVVAVGGKFIQTLTVIHKTKDGLVTDRKEPVRIVPMSAKP